MKILCRLLSFFVAILPLNISAEEITLGALLHLSGDYAMEEAAFREGIELGLEDANRDLKQKNVTLKVDFQDTRLMPVECATLVHRAVANKDIKGLIVSSITEIKNAMYQIKNLQGATGEITVNSKGSAPKYISMFKVKNSKLELVEGPDPE